MKIIVLSCIPHKEKLPGELPWNQVKVQIPKTIAESFFRRSDDLVSLMVAVLDIPVPLWLAQIGKDQFRGETKYLWTVSGEPCEAICCDDFLLKWHERPRGDGEVSSKLKIRFAELPDLIPADEKARRERLAELEGRPDSWSAKGGPGSNLSMPDAPHAPSPLGVVPPEYRAAVETARQKAMARKNDLAQRTATETGEIMRDMRAEIHAADDKFGRPRTLFPVNL